MADTLADAGHNVTLFQYYHLPLKNLDNMVKNKDVQIVHYYPDDFEELEKKGVPTFPELWDSGLMANPVLESLAWPKLLAGEFEKMAKKILKDTNLHDQLRTGKYDAMIVEVFDITGFYLADIINISPIAILTTVRFQIRRLFGEPSTFGYVPEEFSKLGDKATFLDRWNDFYRDTFRTIGNYRMYELQHQNNKKVIDRPIVDWKDLLRRSPFLFANANPYLDYAMPKLENIVNIGGFTFDKNKIIDPLSDEYNIILERRQSTILVSFGSVLRSSDMPEKYKKSLVQTFRTMPDVTFIWKYEQDTDGMLERVPENVHLMKWIPQTALLADERVKLFITHGGLGSTMEVAYSGKPALMIPLVNDQFHNALMLARHGGSISYPKNDFADPEKLIATLQNMLNIPIYHEKAVRLFEILKNQPIDPKETLVKHMEFAIKFANLTTLIPEVSKAGLIGYYFLDVIIVVVVFIVLLILGVFYLFRFGYNKTISFDNKKKIL